VVPTQEKVFFPPKPLYDTGAGSFFQQLEIDLGSEALNWIVKHPTLLPLYLKAARAFEMGLTPSTKTQFVQRDWPRIINKLIQKQCEMRVSFFQ